MYIAFKPSRSDETLAVTKTGSVLTVNGEDFDFAQMSNGDELPAIATGSNWFAGPITMDNNEISLTLRLPHGARAPQETLFPSTIRSGDGDIAIPDHSLPEPVIEIDEDEI